MAHQPALDQAAWASPWRARSVRDKAVLSLGLLVAAVSLPPFPAAAAVAAISLGLLLGPIGVGIARLGRIIWVPLVSILIGVATVAVSVTWADGPVVRVTPAGLTTASQLAVRSVAATLAMFTLACSTPMIDLLSALRQLRVPTALIEIAALIYRFTFGLLESAAAIHAAQAARLGTASRSATMRSASLGAGALFVRSWDRARRLEAGLAGRGYTDALNTLEPVRRRSPAFLAASLAGLAAVTAAALAVEVLG